MPQQFHSQQHWTNAWQMQWDGKGETASGRCEAMDLTHDQCSHHSSRPLLSPHEISFTFFMAMTWKLSMGKKVFGALWIESRSAPCIHQGMNVCTKGGNLASVTNTLSGRWCQVVFQVVYLLSSHVTSRCNFNFTFAFASAPATGCFTENVWKEWYHRSFLPVAVRLYNQHYPQ